MTQFFLEEFSGDLYEDGKSWVDVQNAAISATANKFNGRAPEQQANRRAIGRYCVYCIGKFH
eukprot:6087527-Lingulodinium_polyedra.AAC.1